MRALPDHCRLGGRMLPAVIERGAHIGGCCPSAPRRGVRVPRIISSALFGGCGPVLRPGIPEAACALEGDCSRSVIGAWITVVLPRLATAP
ncbi:hypothetical protein NDU88_004608 [Pleurodeles waltl]|uniref:Uncharacterized protein n=1 Tax=Pleurodeles waltl TaxID=8319 RepID=A0AAV7UFP8_PLEWA|nr:hypothetical protein NDU88_004608 [Pleurodeles waltl]